jgi:hypothetical protein
MKNSMPLHAARCKAEVHGGEHIGHPPAQRPQLQFGPHAASASRCDLATAIIRANICSRCSSPSMKVTGRAIEADGAVRRAGRRSNEGADAFAFRVVARELL